MLVRKHLLQGDKPAGSITMEKSRLNQERTLALRRQDFTEVEAIDAKLTDLAATTAPPGDHNRKDDVTDMLAKVNERNRKANHEVVRKAEIREVERKRRERKIASAGGTVTPHDPSARLKKLPRLFNAATPSSRFVIYLVFAPISLRVPWPIVFPFRTICAYVGQELRTPVAFLCWSLSILPRVPCPHCLQGKHLVNPKHSSLLSSTP
jgi:hypothetical protein